METRWRTSRVQPAQRAGGGAGCAPAGRAGRGKVAGDHIEGTARVTLAKEEKTIEMPWRATRTATSAYFEPTGTNIQ